MKKIFLLIVILILSGCQNNKNHENRFDNNPNTRDDISMYNDEKESFNCFSLCHDKIQEICVDEIVDILSEGEILENSIFNEEACEGICMSKWNDDTLECVGKATKCDSLSQSEPYCKEEEDNSIIEYDPEEEVNYSCSSACYKYKLCALKGDDATSADGNEAYQTCFEECQKWSEATLSCIKKADAGTNMGCAILSKCALNEYKGLLK